MVHIARQAMRRSRHRPLRVLAIAVTATAALVAFRALRSPAYEATITFTISEGDVGDPARGPRPPSDIREHISAVALSNHRLERIMRKHHRSEAWLDKNREAAIEDFRSDITVEVSRDYFIFDRNPGDPPRSAHVAITLQGPDPEEARAILREIGDAVLDVQARQRHDRLVEASEVLRRQHAEARENVSAVQGELARLRVEAAHANPRGGPALRARIRAAEVAARLETEHALELERRLAETSFSVAVEERQLGLRFAAFDDAQAALTPRLTLGQLARRAALIFAVALVLSAAIVGAFDDHVYDAEDLTCRGLPLLGALHGLPDGERRARRAVPPATRA